MARNYRELQTKMNPADVAENKQRVREELQRMALDELRNAKQLTQADMAELLDVPQSSISRIEQRADMYLSTLRNYIQAMGGVPVSYTHLDVYKRQVPAFRASRLDPIESLRHE